MKYTPDYSTPNKKKRFVESELRRMVKTSKTINSDVETYLDGIYGKRRQKAILAYLDKAEEEMKGAGLCSTVEAFTSHELLPINNYNNLDATFDLRIGASLWILGRLRSCGKMLDAFKILPDMSGSPDGWYLPSDFAHPCFSNDLIQSVIYVISHRYSDDTSRGVIITEQNANGEKPREKDKKSKDVKNNIEGLKDKKSKDAKNLSPGIIYNRLLDLLPKDDVEKACTEFINKVWELSIRFLKGLAYYDRAIDKIVNEIQTKDALSNAFSAQIPGSAFMNPTEFLSGRIADRGLGGMNSMRFGPNRTLNSTYNSALRGQKLIEDQREYSIKFDAYLQMNRKSLQKAAGSREVADALEGFIVEDPFELCFALIYLLDSGDDAPWLMRSGSALMLYVLRMLPWYIDWDDWNDDDWDAWYDGLRYDRNEWMKKEKVKDQINYYHEKHGDRNLAQVIYDLCRTIVPTGLHPFEEDRKRLIDEGMDENLARKITDTAELLFLYDFQAKNISGEISFPPDEDDLDLDKDLDEYYDYFEGNAGVIAEKIAGVTANEAEDETVDDDNISSESVTKLGGYWGRMMRNANSSGKKSGGKESHGAKESLDAKELPCAKESHGADKTSEVDANKLRTELREAKKLIKSLRNTLAVTRQEANNERAKYEHELKALRLEHRELADLRELVFNSDNADLAGQAGQGEHSSDGTAKHDKADIQNSYTYETKKRTVIFGGHDTWLKAIKPMLPRAKFVDVNNIAFNPELVRNADVVWIQNNCLSHSQYGNIVKVARQYGIQVRYFAYASAEKCAGQIVDWDRKE